MSAFLTTLLKVLGPSFAHVLTDLREPSQGVGHRDLGLEGFELCGEVGAGVEDGDRIPLDLTKCIFADALAPCRRGGIAIGAGEERQLDTQDHLAGCFRDHPLFLSCLLTVARGILPSAETAEGR